MPVGVFFAGRVAMGLCVGASLPLVQADLV